MVLAFPDSRDLTTEKKNSPQAIQPAGCPVDCLGLTEVVTLVAPSLHSGAGHVL